jgi:hypothetical protein
MSKIHSICKNKCLICDEQFKDGYIMHKTRRQTHSLCIECGDNYLEPIINKIISNARRNIMNMNIKCPGSIIGEHRNMCKKKININDIQLPIICKMRLNVCRLLYINMGEKLVLCFNPNCDNILQYNPNIFRMYCNCGTEWCRKCSISPFHKDKTCFQYQIHKNNNVNWIYMSQMNKEGKLKLCPQCSSPTIKNNGCNKIICVICSLKWCWLCNAPNIDYDHYNPKSATSCSNKLWKSQI